jgi:hypothetical protein
MRCHKAHGPQITDQALAALRKNRHWLTLGVCSLIYHWDAKGGKKDEM